MAKFKTPKNVTSPKPGRGRGVDGSPAAVRARSGQPEDVDGSQLVQRRHEDWAEHQIGWRFFLDSYEGGNRYRNAIYGMDRKGLPIRNLLRHRREVPDASTITGDGGFFGASTMINEGSAMTGLGTGPWPGMLGADPGATAMDDDYEMRRARTPVPEFVSEALGIQLGKLYDQEVKREAPPDVTDWWEDVDGKGTSIDDYMRETVAPLLMALGVLDLVFDHPVVPPGSNVVTRADELALGLDACVVSYVLPQNVVWWRLDRADRYDEVLIREYVDPSDRVDRDKNGNVIDPDGTSSASKSWRGNYVRYRHWTKTESCLYSYDGEMIGQPIPHSYGVVPVIRLKDLKKHRTATVGKSRYEIVCELQRAYYNQLSELILSTVLQGHPFLSGPEDYTKADQTMSVGPQYVLPMKRDPDKGNYQGWEYVAPQNDPTEAMRKNLCELVERIDRACSLTKPAGAAHKGASVVAQSGISKQIDHDTGHKLLTSVAKSLGRAEDAIAEFAMLVLRGKSVTPADRDTIKIGYPSRFDLNDAETLVDATIKLQLVMSNCGNAPETEQALLSATVRQLLVGLDDDDYQAIDDELELLVTTKSLLKEQIHELNSTTVANQSQALAGGGGGVDVDDPTGQAGGTMVGGLVPATVS